MSDDLAKRLLANGLDECDSLRTKMAIKSAMEKDNE